MYWQNIHDHICRIQNIPEAILYFEQCYKQECKVLTTKKNSFAPETRVDIRRIIR